MVATATAAAAPVKKPKKVASAVPGSRKVGAGVSKKSGGSKPGSGYSPIVRALALAFKKEPSPTAEQLEALSKQVKMSCEKLEQWFQQRRVLEAEWFSGVIMRSYDLPSDKAAPAPAPRAETVLSATSPSYTSEVRSEPDEPDETRLLATTSDDMPANLDVDTHSPLEEMTLEDVHGAMSFLLEEQGGAADFGDDDDHTSSSSFADDIFL